MEWFFERLNATAEPIFGHKDKSDHDSDFARLLEFSILKEVDILTEVACDLCDDNHHVIPCHIEGDLRIICGASSRTIASDDLKVWSINWDVLISLMQKDLLITGKAVDETLGEKKLWKLGVRKWGNRTLKCYYLRQDNSLEFERLWSDAANVRNAHSVVFTNTEITDGRSMDNVQFVQLPTLIGVGKSVFGVKGFEDALIKMRRVQFNTRTGNLYLDGSLLHPFGTNNHRKYFMEKLWRHFEEPVTDVVLTGFVRDKVGSSVADTPQKYCAKVKKEIFDACPAMQNILTKPGPGEYMLTEPDR